VVREEAAIVPTGLLTGAGRLGQKQPVVDVGGEQRVGLLVAGAAGPCRRRRQPAVPRWRSGRNNINRVEAASRAGESTWEKEAGQGWGGRMAGRSGGARDTMEASVGDFLRGNDIQCLTLIMGATFSQTNESADY
jgi:hypothetical protein